MQARAFDQELIEQPRSVAERLETICRHSEGRKVFTTSFGLEDQLIAHHIFTARLPIEVLTIDTGRLFPATYRLWQHTEQRYDALIRSVHPEAGDLAVLVASQGVNGFYASKEARLSCCHVRKVAPLRRALNGAAGWVTGLRSDQSLERSGVRFEAWDAVHGLVKFAPLFDRTRDDVLSECTEAGVPINELHAEGYPSIGCEPCTRAVRSGEDERSGRWWWEQASTSECGLHLDSDGRLARTPAP